MSRLRRGSVMPGGPPGGGGGPALAMKLRNGRRTEAGLPGLGTLTLETASSGSRSEKAERFAVTASPARPAIPHGESSSGTGGRKSRVSFDGDDSTVSDARPKTAPLKSLSTSVFTQPNANNLDLVERIDARGRSAKRARAIDMRAGHPPMTPYSVDDDDDFKVRRGTEARL